MFSLQPISSIWPVSIFIDFLIHLPYCILPYSALVITIACPEEQLALNVSQLQYCLLKPVKKCVSGINKHLKNVSSSSFNTCNLKNPTLMLIPNLIHIRCRWITFYNKAYFMMFSLQPTSSISPVSGFIDFRIHLPYCILPYSACVISTMCPEEQLAVNVSQLQNCLLKPAEKCVPVLYTDGFRRMLQHGARFFLIVLDSSNLKNLPVMKWATVTLDRMSIDNKIKSLRQYVFSTANLNKLSCLWICELPYTSSIFHSPVLSMCHKHYMSWCTISLKGLPIAKFTSETWRKIGVHIS